MDDVIYNLVLTHLFSICIRVVCMVTNFMGRARNHSLLLVLLSSPQINNSIFSSVYSTEGIHKKEVRIHLKIKKQANKGNSMQTVKLLQP